MKDQVYLNVCATYASIGIYGTHMVPSGPNRNVFYCWRSHLLGLCQPQSEASDLKLNSIIDVWQGLDKTMKSNFGGGNTNWEEKSLGKWKTR